MRWTTIINDLLQRGHTYASIGKEIGCTGAAVRAMHMNIKQQPRWITGDRLISLHKDVLHRYPNIGTAP